MLQLLSVNLIPQLSPNSSSGIKIHLIKPFLEASLILIKLDSAQVRTEPSDIRSKMTNLQPNELSLCPPQIKAL